MNKLKTLIILMTLFFISCQRESPGPKIVLIHYSNGNLFCEGSHIYSSQKKDSIRVGIWKFYFPNGQLEGEEEYDETGTLIRSNLYSPSGVLIASGSIKEGLMFTSDFYDSGMLKRETVTRIESDEDKSNGPVHYKDYYPNGHLMEELQTIDGEYDGPMKRWDENGNLVLEVNFHKGLVQK